MWLLYYYVILCIIHTLAISGHFRTRALYDRGSIFCHYVRRRDRSMIILVSSARGVRDRYYETARARCRDENQKICDSEMPLRPDTWRNDYVSYSMIIMRLRETEANKDSSCHQNRKYFRYLLAVIIGRSDSYSIYLIIIQVKFYNFWTLYKYFLHF